MENKKSCFECGTKDNYELKDTIRVYEGDSYDFELWVNIPFCKNCGAPIYDEELENEIAQRANKKIREQRGIITREGILEIIESYNVSQKFLSKLLGWGEITLTRYISGNYTPNITNSNRLKELKNPYVFQDLLYRYSEKKISDSEEKLLKKVQSQVSNKIDKMSEDQGRIISVVNWFLAQSSEETPVTHLALQKLLYFTQGWSMVLSGKEMFDDDCQAWAHGAVYPKVYELFKRFKYMPLPKIYQIAVFDEKDLNILTMVKQYYFDVYSAKALEEICHKEEPYRKAREGCRDGEICNAVINKKNIALYYDRISREYDIGFSSMVNVKKYLNLILG